MVYDPLYYFKFKSQQASVKVLVITYSLTLDLPMLFGISGWNAFVDADMIVREDLIPGKRTLLPNLPACRTSVF